jgi:hypothetical protein
MLHQLPPSQPIIDGRQVRDLEMPRGLHESAQQSRLGNSDLFVHTVVRYVRLE